MEIEKENEEGIARDRITKQREKVNLKKVVS